MIDTHAQFVAQADQAYADVQPKLDHLIDSLVSDMRERAHDESDGPYWAATFLKTQERIADLGYVSDDFMAVYTAAIYRLARARVAQ